MLRENLLKKFPTAKISERIFGSVIDLSRHLFGERKDYLRQRAMRFLILAGAVEIVLVARLYADERFDRNAYRLSKYCLKEKGLNAWKALSIRIAKNTKNKITPDFVHDVLSNGIPVGRRGRPKKSVPVEAGTG